MSVFSQPITRLNVNTEELFISFDDRETSLTSQSQSVCYLSLKHYRQDKVSF